MSTSRGLRAGAARGRFLPSVTRLARQVVPVLAAVAAGSSAFHLTVTALPGFSADLPPAAAVLLPGELALVLAVVVLPLAVPRPPGMIALLAASIAAVLVGGFAASTKVAPLVAMWALGLTLALPLPLYVLATCTGVVAIAGAARRPDRGARVASLVLLILAGHLWPGTAGVILALAAGAVAEAWSVAGGPAVQVLPVEAGKATAGVRQGQSPLTESF